jgi:hypothetical protein
VLGFAMRGQARGVSGEKGERGIWVFAVFCEIEMDPAHLVPSRVAAVQKFGQGRLRCGQLCAQRCLSLRPQLRQNVGIGILRPAHGRQVKQPSL